MEKVGAFLLRGYRLTFDLIHPQFLEFPVRSAPLSRLSIAVVLLLGITTGARAQKKPPEQLTAEEIRRRVQDFIADEGRERFDALRRDVALPVEDLTYAREADRFVVRW